MAKLKEIIFDALEPPKLARFWARVLDGYAVRPYDDDELKRLAGLGLSPETDTNVAIDGPGPSLFFQATSKPKVGRNRLHLDVICDSRAEEIQRLVDLGATIRDHHHDDGYTVMLDPEGNEFCVQGP